MHRKKGRWSHVCFNNFANLIGRLICTENFLTIFSQRWWSFTSYQSHPGIMFSSRKLPKRAGERSSISLWFHDNTICCKTTFHLKRYVLGIVWKYARDMFNVQMGQNHPCIIEGMRRKVRWAMGGCDMNIEFAFLLIADATEKNMHRNLCFASNDFLSNRWLLILGPKWPLPFSRHFFKGLSILICMMEPESNEESPPGLPWLPRYWELECPVQQHLMEAAMCLRETGRYEDLWLQIFSSFKSCDL